MVISVKDCRGAERPPQRSEEAGAIADPRKARPERSEGNTRKKQKERTMSESQNIEYKESWRDEYLKWICGFANAQGGSIFIGIDDSGNVVGVKNCKKLMEDIPNKIQAGLGIVADVNKKTKGGLDYIEIADKVIDLIYIKYLKAKITYEHDKRKDEAIIISNECVLPEGWTAETFLKTHESNLYNPDIVNVFYCAGYIENWGRGIEKICDSCKKNLRFCTK